MEDSRSNWQAAEKLYQQALQFQPDYPVAANDLACLILEHVGDKDIALSMAQTARPELPDLASTADTLAWTYYSRGGYATAIDLLQQTVKVSPSNVTYHYHLGLALKLNPAPSQAEEIRKALANSADD